MFIGINKFLLINIEFFIKVKYKMIYIVIIVDEYEIIYLVVIF